MFIVRYPLVMTQNLRPTVADAGVEPMLQRRDQDYFFRMAFPFEPALHAPEIFLHLNGPVRIRPCVLGVLNLFPIESE